MIAQRTKTKKNMENRLENDSEKIELSGTPSSLSTRNTEDRVQYIPTTLVYCARCPRMRVCVPTESIRNLQEFYGVCASEALVWHQRNMHKCVECNGATSVLCAFHLVSM